MKQVFTLLLICLSTVTTFGQQKATVSPYAAIDKKASKLPDSTTQSTVAIARYIQSQFSTDREKVRAAFIWLAANIEYDLPNMFAINFYEKPSEKVAKALATRKGICEHYAILFQEICTNMDIRSYVVYGYTKQKGFTDYIPHAWCIALVGGDWQVYDPTWGSGYVSNRKFVRKLNEEYCAAKPQSIIKSHMPFDYLWQCLHYPISNQEFYDGKISENISKPYFSYPDSITAYASLNNTEQLSAAARRIEAAGLKNSMIFDRLHHIKAELESASVDVYNDAVFDYNNGVRYLNDFIEYRNVQFVPIKPDKEIKEMLDIAAAKFTSAKKKLQSIDLSGSKNAAIAGQLKTNIDEAVTKLEAMQAWLTKYFAKSRMGRRSMFYKVTWFGMPVN